MRSKDSWRVVPRLVAMFSFVGRVDVLDGLAEGALLVATPVILARALSKVCGNAAGAPWWAGPEARRFLDASYAPLAHRFLAAACLWAIEERFARSHVFGLEAPTLGVLAGGLGASVACVVLHPPSSHHAQ